MRRLAAALLCIVASVTFADDLPAGLRTDGDLRGSYRAALCERADMTPADCARDLRTYAGETPAPKPRPADPSRWRLVFVPGYLAVCFPGIRSFDDVIAAARKQGFAAQVLDVGGRDGVQENAVRIRQQMDAIPVDGRRIIFIGHSKGAVDALQALVNESGLRDRVAAVLTVAGALQGSRVADTFVSMQDLLHVLPVGDCGPGEGKPIYDLTTTVRAAWWNDERVKVLPTPLYSLVTLPDLDRLSSIMVPPFALVSAASRDNDGLLLAGGQVTKRSHLLGVVNADHLTAAIPHPGGIWVFLLRSTPFARPQVILAAVDVIASREQ